MVTGLILISYNDMKRLETAHDTLISSVEGHSYGIMGIDIGSTDGSLEYLQERMFTMAPKYLHEVGHLLIESGIRNKEDFRDLSRCLNAGINVFMNHSEIDKIGWIHPDMDFWNEGKGKGWLQACEKYLDDHPDVAKVAPEIQPPGPIGERPGNQCPWILKREAIQAMLDKHGRVFDSAFIGCGGFEDWNLNKELMDLGYKVMIASTPVILHEGMGTRKESNTNPDQFHNANIYGQKWGTNQAPV